MFFLFFLLLFLFIFLFKHIFLLFSFCWEIDQTRMEAHCRVPGSLRFVMGLLERVMAHVMDKFSGQLTHQYSARLRFDKEKGMRIRMQVANVCYPGGKKSVTLKFEDFYLDSGWLLTSLANFLLETGATASCSVENPAHMSAKNAQGELHIEKGTFNHLYRGLAIDGKKPSRPVYYRPKHEGDDGAGQISRHAGERGKLEQLVVDNMADLGFDAKLKIIQDGRLEFVGLHALAKDGAIDPEVPIAPGIKRSFGKLGTNVQPGARRPEQLAAVDAMRFLSIGEMFAGRIPAAANIFINSAKNNARKAGKYSAQTHYCNEYTVVGRAFGEGTYSLDQLVARSSARQEEAPAVSVQTRALAMSLERNSVDPSALAKLEILAEGCNCDNYDHMACYLQLPAELRAGEGSSTPC